MPASQCFQSQAFDTMLSGVLESTGVTGISKLDPSSPKQTIIKLCISFSTVMSQGREGAKSEPIQYCK